MPRIVIVGAGISGLAAAWRLQNRLPDAEITVLEAANRPGGTLWTERKQGFQIELGANGILDTKPAAIQLIRELGLGNDLIPASPQARKRFLFLNDDLAPMPHSLGTFLKSPLLSWKSKWRLATERFRKRKTDERDESVYDFIARRASPETAEMFGDAFVTGIFAGDARKLSLAAAFPRLAQAEREFGSVTRGLARLNRQSRRTLAMPGQPPRQRATLWSFKPGLRVLAEILAMRLKPQPLLGVPARGLQVDPNAGPRPVWEVHADGQDHFKADAVILTCPAPRQAALVADVDPELADQILHIPYASVAVVGLGYKEEEILRPLVGSGYLAPQIGRRDLLGVQYCSKIWPERAPNGCVLLRAMCGGWHRPEVANWDDDKLSHAVRLELRLTLGILGRPVVMHIARWDPAIPQYTLGHLDRVRQIEERAATHPGLFLSGNAYRGVAINECVEEADRVAGRVAGYLANKA